MATNDKPLTGLMADIKAGNIKLPDFQRGWVWDDNRIKALIASIISGYPAGAVMFLEYGNEKIRFKHRPVEGTPDSAKTTEPAYLILDGQQRLTSLYCALYNNAPARTHTEKNKDKDIYRYYYIDMKKIFVPAVDRSEAIVSVPQNKKITSDFGRKDELDVSTQEKEFEAKMFPLNIILDSVKWLNWQNAYLMHYKYDPAVTKEFTEFIATIVQPTMSYMFPVITLGKNTPKDAVCQVFENVNTGGVSLTVFELITAIFAMDNYELRKEWEAKKKDNFSGDILSVLTPTDFLTACTLLTTYRSGGTVSCKKKDVLNLSLEAYLKCEKELTQGFVEAESILQDARIYSVRDLPYSTQLIPLAVICTILAKGSKIKATSVREKIMQWYWCGVFGEMYGSANENRYVYDVVDVVKWIANEIRAPKTVQEAYFAPTRLLSLRSRQSAAYKGVMALIFNNHSKDFISGSDMDLMLYKSAGIDIHHIFPQKYCLSRKLDESKWNSVVNKTPISYSTNREIGGIAPSKYLQKIITKGLVDAGKLDIYLQSHWIDPDSLKQDDFDSFFINRAKELLNAIERAMGKPIAGRDGEDVIKNFGAELV